MKEILKSKSFIKLSVLTVLNALYAAVSPVIILFVALYVYDMLISVEAIAWLCVAIIYFGVPILMSFLLVDRIKWWLISLPVQFLLGLGMLFTPLNLLGGVSVGYLLGSIPFALIPIVAQAVGVGIKVLWSRHKRR